MTSPEMAAASSAPGHSTARVFLERHATAVRVALFAFVLLIACPIRYWPLQPGFDPTWQFALNYAAANGYVIGRDYVYTTGPLAYLIFPLHLGGNLFQGLLFQAALWVVVGAILADVFFRADMSIENLALFAVCFGLAAPWFWFNFLGPENLLLAAAMLLLVVVYVRGGWLRYLTALVLIGLLPLLKLTAGVIGLTALFGFILARMLDRRPTVRYELPLAAVVPLTVACVGFLLMVPIPSAMLRFARGSAEIMSGYSSAMSDAGDRSEILVALEVLAVMAVVLHAHATANRPLARFYALMLAGPLFFSIKHGFVRQDEHVINFFCFAALALALLSLTVRPEKRRRVTVALVLFAALWQQPLGTHYGRSAPSLALGYDSIRMLAGLVTPGGLRHRLDSAATHFPQGSRPEPAVLAIVGKSSVASLSDDFTNLFAAGLRPSLFPSLQRSVGYTPFLDNWNAAWVRNSETRFLLFDGTSIDNRDAWAETPAMWLEIYRWYDTRFLGTRTLVLERRATPRFRTLESISRSRVDFSGALTFPTTPEPVFWTMNCRYSFAGKLRKLLTRAPAVSIDVKETSGAIRSARVIPEVLVSPVMGNSLPSGLAQFAAVFEPSAPRRVSVERIVFGEAGGTSLASPCDAELLRPVP